MDASYAAAYPELYRHHWWWRVREAILVAKIRRILHGAARARILDVGCGAALFFDALQRFGSVEGIESDPKAVEQSGRWRSRVMTGELDDAYRPSAPFDLVLMLDVLEHVADAHGLLRRAGEILAPGGRVLVTVPAFKWLWTAHDEMNHHMTRYTASQLRGEMERAGLANVETGYLFQSLVLAKLMVRVRETLSHAAVAAASGTPSSGRPTTPKIPPSAVNGAVQKWFRAEHAIAGWLPFGTSVWAVAARGLPEDQADSTS